jgi:predicted DNA-binding ribbon-helix-helix protein
MNWSVEIHGKGTSVSLEPEFYEVLKRMGKARGGTVSELVEEIAESRTRKNLSSEIRVRILQWSMG